MSHALVGRRAESHGLGGFSDDIGDISWKVPTVSMRFPSNIPGGPGHHWANAVGMATPIAHKGAVAGARVIAMTLMDLFLNPELVTARFSGRNPAGQLFAAAGGTVPGFVGRGSWRARYPCLGLRSRSGKRSSSTPASTTGPRRRFTRLRLFIENQRAN